MNVVPITVKHKQVHGQRRSISKYVVYKQNILLKTQHSWMGKKDIRSGEDVMVEFGK